jgi:hypothetical protein
LFDEFIHYVFGFETNGSSVVGSFMSRKYVTPHRDEGIQGKAHNSAHQPCNRDGNRDERRSVSKFREELPASEKRRMNSTGVWENQSKSKPPNSLWNWAASTRRCGMVNAGRCAGLEGFHIFNDLLSVWLWR